jgi:uncharacterized protein
LTFQTVALLLGAGLIGGMANAMAGGATLITFPAMMAAGLPPIVANASNALAVVFGNLMGAWTERSRLPPFSAAMALALASALVGGAAGAVMLLWTPEGLFVMIVPGLIGLATLVFAFSKSIQSFVSSRWKSGSEGLRAALVLPAAVYGGYFGAGLGVVLMAVLSATSAWELRTSNALKNALSVIANAAAIVIFIVQGVISWPETLVMMAAAMAGGYLGGRALAIVSAATVRKAIIVIGILMTLIYAWRYWL